MHWSSTISGTDINAHRHYSLAAERQRQLIVRKMNEDMMLNGAGLGYDYLASEDFWRTVPDFVYRPPSVSCALRAALPDGLVLLAWGALAVLAAWLSARHQRAI
jgi:ABC-2 type transport system permease protein